MTGLPYVLAIDFGTTYTAAALRTGDRATVLNLESHSRMSSAVFLAENGELVIGQAAEQRAGGAPERFERTPKVYLDVGEPGLVLGPELFDIRDVVGLILRAVWDEALRHQDDQPPAELRLTHPASWSSRRKGLLREAAERGGLPAPVLLGEPEAAALYLAGPDVTGARVDDDGLVAVYDLGGGTLDAAVLRRKGDHFELVGAPNGDDRLGGTLFDDRLYRHLGASGLPPEDWERLQASAAREWQQANQEFRRAVREAKEAVSRTASHPVYVPHPVDRELQVTREDFEDLIRPDLERSVEILEQTVTAAGVAIDSLARVFLTGGSSRIPLAAQLVRAATGQASFKGDPKTVVALGAASAPVAEVPASSPAAGDPPPAADEETFAPWYRTHWRLLTAGVTVLIAAIALYASVGPLSGDGNQRASGTAEPAPRSASDRTIRPDQGIGPVNLGDRRSDVETLLGPGDDDPEVPGYFSWELDGGSLSVAIEDGRVIAISTSSGAFTLAGARLDDETAVREELSKGWQTCPDGDRAVYRVAGKGGPSSIFVWRDDNEPAIEASVLASAYECSAEAS